MNIHIITVGKIKENYLRDAIGEYEKRLSRYASVNILECADEKCAESLSDAEKEKVKSLEGARILEKIREKDHVIALAIDGKSYDSEGFADRIDHLMKSGHSDICFVIGGSLGLSKEVLSRADESVSFSRLTFPHQLMRVILLEQVYRAFRILRNEPYHK